MLFSVILTLITSQIFSHLNASMIYIHNAPESKNDVRYNYQWEILKTALEKTKIKYGDYEIKPAIKMTEKRQSFELKKGSDLITIMYLGTTSDFEKNLIPIRIPVDKNLSGYMIYLIRKENQPKFSAVKSLDDLRKFSIGLGDGWLDVDILRASNFNVVTGSNYNGLFYMLRNKRFDAFQRSVVEIIEEYENYKKDISSLHIEEDLLFYYPLPMYFWFSKTKEGKKLAIRAEEGMLQMIKDGSYDKIFFKYHKYKIDKLNLKNRKVFKINNPLLGPKTPFENSQLWYNPLTK